MKYKRFIVMFGILAIIVFLEYDVGIPCIFNKLTGLYCPGCGATRTIISLIKLNFYQALRYNAIITIFIPSTIIFTCYKYIFNRDAKVPNWVWYVLLAITLAYGIMRNIPYFSFLAPTQVI